ncbi:MAG: hypothetical protein JXA81_05340 [Sedimentisphaerales bacterium]|nr:hypothetical protein [Sedimentisphaerales bacterium]
MRTSTLNCLVQRKSRIWNAEGSGDWLEFSVGFVADDVPDSVGKLLGIEIDNVSAISRTGMNNVRLSLIK